MLRRGAQASLILFRRHFMITLEVPCRDKSYQWLLQWITQKGARKTQHLSVETSFTQNNTGHVKTKYDFIPSIGTHIMYYSGTWIKVERTREVKTKISFVSRLLILYFSLTLLIFTWVFLGKL